jgi:hypothetical protein
VYVTRQQIEFPCSLSETFEQGTIFRLKPRSSCRLPATFILPGAAHPMSAFWGGNGGGSSAHAGLGPAASVAAKRRALHLARLGGGAV